MQSDSQWQKLDAVRCFSPWSVYFCSWSSGAARHHIFWFCPSLGQAWSPSFYPSNLPRPQCHKSGARRFKSSHGGPAEGPASKLYVWGFEEAELESGAEEHSWLMLVLSLWRCFGFWEPGVTRLWKRGHACGSEHGGRGGARGREWHVTDSPAGCPWGDRGQRGPRDRGEGPAAPSRKSEAAPPLHPPRARSPVGSPWHRSSGEPETPSASDPAPAPAARRLRTAGRSKHTSFQRQEQTKNDDVT